MFKMTSFSFLSLCLTVLLSTAHAQQAAPQTADQPPQNGNRATAEKIDQDSKNLDGIIKDINGKIQAVIQKNKMMEIKDIKVIPYQTEYLLEKDFIQVERHMFIRDNNDKIVGEKKKTVRFYASGGTLSKIESIVYERDYSASDEMTVIVTDPSPLSDNKDNLVIKQIRNKKVIVEGKALSDVKNTTAFPVRNEFKRDFYISHISYFYNLILGIAETYSKTAKDTDAAVNEFLMKSTRY
jgi:hypothetical protein